MAQSCAQAQGWVRDNYERHPDGVVAKSVIYKHYEDYCREQGRPVMETSIFGRVVKQVFHDVNIRRLGGRDNLKYYYCGIQAQYTSPYVGDNSNTTRPKRKQRKRDIIEDKMEAQNCLRWLRSNYTQDLENCSIPRCELYSDYTRSCCNWTNDPLSLQQFTLVVMNAFSRIHKRKIGPKSPQQYAFVGISRLTVPIDPNTIPNEVISLFESLSANNKLSNYREGSNTPDDEEDYSCRSPDSEEGSDMSAGNSENSCSELKSDSLPDSYQYYAIKNEPVDYSIATLRLKDEPIDLKEESIDTPMSEDMKREKLSVSSLSCFISGTPEGPPSHMMDSPTPSPSPPQKSTKSRIYKPRFHINYHDQEWDSEADIKLEHDQVLMENVQSHWDDVLKRWLLECLENSEGVCVERSEIYSLYKRYCFITNTDVVHIDNFDKIVLKTYPNTVTMVHLLGSIYYKGVRAIHNSDIDGLVKQLLYTEQTEVPQTSWEGDRQASLEMSSPGHSSSPITLDDDEDDDNIDDGFPVDKYREPPDDDLHSIPEVLRDGKYYLKNWLMENFESVPEACVLKADAYRHYEMYAKSVMQTPFEMNVFGKIVRQVFPKVSIRRLGGRMKPQYHYCGITAKPTSCLYALLSGKDPAQRSRKKEIATDNRTAEVVIDWLKRSYEAGKDRIIMKSDVFNNYNAYCHSLGESPVSLNYFGKLVKHCFPNVEVRKFGGRSDPNWYYFGLNPKDLSMPQHSMLIEEFGEPDINQYTASPCHSQSAEHQPSHHSHHPLNTSNPIAVPGGGTAGAHNSPYTDSPQICTSSIGQQFTQFQLLRQQPQSPYSSSSSMEPRSALAPEPCLRSPGLSRAFREGLMPHATHDGGRMMVRSPYEPADVAPENIFPRSPEDTSAQTCRSPAVSQSDAGVLHMSPAYMTSHGLLSSSQGVLLSSSPNSKRGAHVVPSQTPPYHLSSSLDHHQMHNADSVGLYAHKRIKHQVAPEDYNVFSGRS